MGLLHETFFHLFDRYSGDSRMADQYWQEIVRSYSGKKRYYHTLAHLDNMLHQLLEVKEQIENWDTILFSLYYHDIVYNVLHSDNEERSAALAGDRLKAIGIPAAIVDHSKAQIIATKTHAASTADTNYFTDADLSILGQDRSSYDVYRQQVRKEYAMFPGIIYNPGRKKVLTHFLEMERIYKSDYFFNKYESIARNNLSSELLLLK